MSRSVNTPASKKRRKRVLKDAKGYWGRRKNVWTVAKNAVQKALCYAYRDRRTKKRVIRTNVWIPRINAGARALGTNYRDLMHLLKVKNIIINRKVIADLAMNNADCFAAVVNKAR